MSRDVSKTLRKGHCAVSFSLDAQSIRSSRRKKSPVFFQVQRWKHQAPPIKAGLDQDDSGIWEERASVVTPGKKSGVFANSALFDKRPASGKEPGPKGVGGAIGPQGGSQEDTSAGDLAGNALPGSRRKSEHELRPGI